MSVLAFFITSTVHSPILITEDTPVNSIKDEDIHYLT